MRLTGPGQVASSLGRLMDGFGAPWCVAGGWALDLFLGRVTRPHSDVELAVFRRDQEHLQSHFRGWAFTASVNGRREAWHQRESLKPPVHEIHAYSPDEPPQSLEFLLNERDDTNWVFRRNAAVVLPLDRATVDTQFGVAALSPEIVLLFKAKAPREKDEADFHAAREVLSDLSRQWLRSALLECHPDHPWIRWLAPGREA